MGPSVNDRTHNINGIYSYYPFKGTTLTAAGLLQSGQPINRIPLGFGTTDLNGDGASFRMPIRETVFSRKAETMIVCHGVLLLT
jgi:hypothetical protein